MFVNSIIIIQIGAKIESSDCTSVKACVAKGDRGTFVSFNRPVCGRNAVCKPVGGHYKCACKPGLTGDPLKECISKYILISAQKKILDLY